MAKIPQPKRELVPAGYHLARCVGVIHLGLQETPFGLKDQIKFIFELPKCRHKGADANGNTTNRPKWISRTFNFTRGRGNSLIPFLEKWRGRELMESEKDDFPFKLLINRACQVLCIHRERNGEIRDDLDCVTPVPGKQAVPPLENPPLYFMWDDGFPIPDDFPDWLKDILLKARQANRLTSGTATDVAGDDWDDEAPTPSDEEAPPEGEGIDTW